MLYLVTLNPCVHTLGPYILRVTPLEEQMADEEWDPDILANKLNASLQLEEQVHPDETHKERSQRLLDENSPRAALAIVHLATYGHNESIRLKAATYIVDRNLGRVPLGTSDEKQDWEKALEGLLGGNR